MDTLALRAEHSAIMGLASRLGGIAGAARTRDDAHDARAAILAIDALLQRHLAEEDADLYPALTDAPDAQTRLLGAAAYAEMGGIAGAWANYRDHWTVEVMLCHPGRFAAATEGFIGALSLRIAMENDVLYLAIDRLTGARRRSAA